MGLLLLLSLLSFTITSIQAHSQAPLGAINASFLTINNIPYDTRAYWMRVANAALGQLSSPCPFSAFGTAIVNHTYPSSLDNGGRGKLICLGINDITNTGNPTLHGEIAAITNCTAIMTDKTGEFNFTAAQAQAAFADLSLYTNAESCPMCASAIRWAGFSEYIYGTSIDTLIKKGWAQIRVSSFDIFKETLDLPTKSRMIADILTNETDPFFLWQFNPAFPCPAGCQRNAAGTSCIKS